MPGQMTAAALVQEVRELVGEFSQDAYRDGFTADETDGMGNPRRCTSILNRLNRAFNDLLPTGFCKCLFTMNITPSNPNGLNYGMNNAVNEIVHCSINGKALQRVTVLELDGKFPSWQDTTYSSSGTPRYYYNYADVIGFYPFPDQVYTAEFLADTIPTPLVAANDIPQRLPGRYHYMLAVGAALEISVADVENEAAERRLGYLQSKWNKGFSELETMINSRGDDFDDQVGVQDYRGFFR